MILLYKASLARRLICTKLSESVGGSSIWLYGRVAGDTSFLIHPLVFLSFYVDCTKKTT